MIASITVNFIAIYAIRIVFTKKLFQRLQQKKNSLFKTEITKKAVQLPKPI